MTRNLSAKCYLLRIHAQVLHREFNRAIEEVFQPNERPPPEIVALISSMIEDAFSISLGSLVDCVDAVGRWWPYTVIMIKYEQVLLHYESWEDKWNEWIPIFSPRIAP